MGTVDTLKTLIKGPNLVFLREKDMLVDNEGNDVMHFSLAFWGKIRKRFRRSDESLDWTKFEKNYQDIGFFFRDTINDRLNGQSFTTREILAKLEDFDTLQDAIDHFKDVKNGEK